MASGRAAHSSAWVCVALRKSSVSDSSMSGHTQYTCRPWASASRMRATTSPRLPEANSLVSTGVRPGGSSSSVLTSRSAYSVMAKVRGMGVALIMSR